MGPCLGFLELITRTPRHHVAAMLDEQVERIDQGQLPRLPVDDGEVYDAKGLLHRGQLVQIVKNYIRNGVSFELDHDPHAFAVRLVAQVRDSLDLLVVNQLGNSSYKLRLIDLIRNLGYDNR